MLKCLSKYDSKLKKENEKILNAAAKFEVNQDLKSFDKEKKNLLEREKLELEFDDSLEGSEEEEKESFSEKLKKQMNQIKGIQSE